MPKTAATAAEDPPSKPPPKKRDRRNRYRNASPSTLSRRREQNRVSQQTFREKKDQRIKELESQLQEAEGKDQHIKELESQLQEAEKKCELLGRDFAALLREHMKMKAAAHRNISNPLNVAVANGASVGQAPTNMQDMHQGQSFIWFSTFIGTSVNGQKSR
ncbi:hypothetical protein BJ166DRAFT_496574 [Pestalotiopsis sp. NC0098]|nr:hypothetical protein BJ166DRAFT_496574 [Pestalotiopsis sp. NC0098]